MPVDEPDSLVAILPRSVAAIIEAQQQLDALATTPAEEESETRFWLTSIPAADLRLEFGLSVSERHGFLIPRSAQSSLRHLVSIDIAAVPEPIEPEPPGGRILRPYTLFEPAFMVDPQREVQLGLDVCRALQQGVYTVRVPEPKKIRDAAIRAAGAALERELVRPNHPELGVIAFRVDESPPIDLVVIVTEDSEKDGVFLVQEGQPPALYSTPDDRNDEMFYEPLDRLTLALGRWLADAGSSRRAAVQRLPQEWGFTTLELFAGNLTAGYEQTLRLLAEPRLTGALTQHFDVARVSAQVSFAICQGRAPLITIAQDVDADLHLIQGEVAIELERAPAAIATTLTLVAPGFVLAPRHRDAFIARAQRAARRIAGQFEEDRSIDYAAAVARPAARERVVVLLSTDDGERFRYLVTWPVHTPDAGERHFVFRCSEKDDALDDVEPVMRVSDSPAQVAVGSMTDAAVDDDVYKEFNRFFRAARIWRSGVARHLQRALLEKQ